MSKKKNDIREFAKDLYVQFDADGKRKYSLNDIAKQIDAAFSKKFTRQAVYKWKHEEDWDKLLQKVKQHAIEKARDEKFTAEEKIVDARSDDLADVYRFGKQLASIGTKVFQDYYSKNAHDYISVRESLAAARIGVNIMLRLNDIPDAEEADFGMIYIPDNGR